MSDDPGRYSFFEELKRRKVVRVAVVYGATVFAVLQVADLLVEPLALPGWTMRFLVLLAAAGLPVALVLAWAFELTPDGVTRTADPAPGATGGADGQAASALLSRRTILSVGGLLLVGFGAGWFFGPGQSGSGGTAAPGGSVSGMGLTAIRSNGIAVLPFASRSAGEGDADFFAAGLHDDLLTQLAGLEELVVISRTSVEQYRGTDKGIPEIGRELAVAYVLEGGVQQAGDRIRVNAQLIDARTDEHLWAETFDGDLSMADLFAIQGELAGRIVGAMETTIGGDLESRLAGAPTESLEAWEALARGRSLWDTNDLPGAERAFEAAVAADPAFAEAWAHLSEARSTIHWFGLDRAEAALEALDRALVLAPEAPATDWAKATYEYYVLTSYPAALASVDRAVGKEPGRAAFLHTRGNVLRRLGAYREAADVFTRSAELDPLNPLYLSVLLETLAIVGDAEALGSWTDAFLALPEIDRSSLHTVLTVPMTTGRGGLAYTRDVLARLDPELRRTPEVRLPALWADLLDPAAAPPRAASIRQALLDGGWTSERGILLLVEVATLLVPPDADRDHLVFLLDGLDRRLATSGGAQAEALDRSVRAYVLASLGRGRDALSDAEASIAWVRRTGDRNVGGPILYNVAMVFETLGERARALAILEEGAPLWTFPRRMIPMDPQAADLVADPRVNALLREARPGG